MSRKEGEFKFECAKCGQRIAVSVEQAGIIATCPSCRSEITVPKPAQLRAEIPVSSSFSSPARLFAAVFLAMIIGGGCLMVGWYIFLRDRGTKPFTLSSKPTSDSILERKGQLEGEVFVVTKGGQNYKLGLVPVALLPMERVQSHVAQKRAEADSALKELGPKVTAAKAEMEQADGAERAAFQASLNFSAPNRNELEAAHERARLREDTARNAYYALVAQQQRYMSGAYFFDGLPEPIVTTQTNSDGKFTVEMPTRGQFAIAAAGRRSVGDSTEHYYWLLKCSLDGAAKKSIMLSNNNLSSEGSPDSLITTVD